MRHGANIPDIRALQAFLSSIDTNVQDIETLLGALVAASAATVDVSSGAVELDPYETRRLAQPDVARMTVENPSQGTFYVGEYDAQTVEVAPGDVVTVDNNASQPIYVTAAGRRATAFARVERNTTGTYTPTLSNVDTLTTGNVSTKSYMGYDVVVLYDLPAGDYFQAFNLTDGSSAFTFDLLGAIGASVRDIQKDVVRGGDNWIVANTNDQLSSHNVRRGTDDFVDFYLDPIDNVIPIRTDAFAGYALLFGDDFNTLLFLDRSFNELNNEPDIPDAAELIGAEAVDTYTNNYFCVAESGADFYYIRHGTAQLESFTPPGNYDATQVTLGNDRAYFLSGDEDTILRLDFESGLAQELPYFLSTPDSATPEVQQGVWRVTQNEDRNYFSAGELLIRGFGGQPQDVISQLGLQFNPVGDDLIDMLDGSVFATLSTSLSQFESVYDPRTDRVLLLDGSDFVLATIDLGWDPTP